MPEIPQQNLSLHGSGPTSSSYKSDSDISDFTDDTRKLLPKDASELAQNGNFDGIRSFGLIGWGFPTLSTLALLGHSKGTEKRQSDVDPANSVSRTAFRTRFGTVWFTSAVFVTQKLAIHANLHARQTLTATRDNLSAWGGLGSALSSLYSQFYLPASVTRTFVVTAYLGSIPLLHVTTPAIFSVDTGFNSSSPGLIKVETWGLPRFNQTIGTPNFDQSFPYNFSDFSVNAEYVPRILARTVPVTTSRFRFWQ
ncbi:hypothetical protein GGX14DRAFT_408521 [Mycena pura]|uniref:Uncharacterized protein n=1 Tax=Mycena pura TaxID=153505 RepID=A0AAD6XXP2_9AGAR|nr:hypothetical protein GGX14DRAFT_408521 [Mycena pura]